MLRLLKNIHKLNVTFKEAFLIFGFVKQINNFIFQPCKVRNWELQVHFKVHGHGKDLYGDGLVIWYARDRMVLGSMFGSMDYFQGLGIILDTYSNHNGPHNVRNFYFNVNFFNFYFH